MGIWIRSQNGNLLVLAKAFSTGLNSNRQEAACVFGRADAIDRLGLPLGDYTTEAEAIKVLDMIEGAIGTLTVFQMPPAGFTAEPEKFMPDCAGDLNNCGLLDGTAPEGRKCYKFDECKAAWDRGCRP